MQREIKFRLYSNTLKVMYSPETQIGHLWSIKESHNGKVKVDEGDMLMQFTGFKDKNGKEIYEGDIVREKLIDRMQEEGWSWNYSIVEFEKGCWVLNEVGFDYSKYDSLDDFDHLYDACQDVEICGNIYENPELIN